MNSEQEERAGGATEETADTMLNSSIAARIESEQVTAAPGGAIEIVVPGDATKGAGTVPTTTAATAVAITTTATVTGVGENEPLPLDNARIRDSLEAIKTAVVWLVVINILTVLSPLLRVPLKWTLAVGVLLIVGSLVLGCVAYLKARGAQRRIPE